MSENSDQSLIVDMEPPSELVNKFKVDWLGLFFSVSQEFSFLHKNLTKYMYMYFHMSCSFSG